MGRIELGQKVKDIISGMEGNVTAVTDFLYGCRRIQVQPKGLHEGKPIEAQWFDEPQLSVLDVGLASTPLAEPTGGPRDVSPRRSDASR